MAWAVDLGASARFAKPVLVHGAHEVVINTPTDRVSVWLVAVEGINDLDCHAIDLFAAEDRKGQAVDFVKRNVRVFKRVLHFLSINQ